MSWRACTRFAFALPLLPLAEGEVELALLVLALDPLPMMTAAQPPNPPGRF